MHGGGDGGTEREERRVIEVREQQGREGGGEK